MLRDTAVRKIIILGMLPVGKKLEKIIPGTADSVVIYNDIMRKMPELFAKVDFVNMKSIVDNHGINAVTEDSMHFSAAGHAAVAECIDAIIHRES
jgi:lysophospholipase L1-like esterase